MDKDKRFTIIVGGITVLEEKPDGTVKEFFSVGPRYPRQEEHALLAIEKGYIKHGDEIGAGMDGFTDDMMKLGIQRAMGNPKVSEGLPMVEKVVGDADDDDSIDDDKLTARQRRRRAKRKNKGR